MAVPKLLIMGEKLDLDCKHFVLVPVEILFYVRESQRPNRMGVGKMNQKRLAAISQTILPTEFALHLMIFAKCHQATLQPPLPHRVAWNRISAFCYRIMDFVGAFKGIEMTGEIYFLYTHQRTAFHRGMPGVCKGSTGLILSLRIKHSIQQTRPP